MATGRPDYTNTTVIKGLSPSGAYNPVALDASGNLLAVIYGSDGAVLRQIKVDTSGQIIMVPRGQSGYYMAVDSAGNLASVMKGIDGITLRTVAVDPTGHILGLLQGDYEGAVKTLAVDSQGRMLAVLTDPEDVFGNPNYMGAAELAARLGSIANFERRGNIYLMDDFENGLTRWSKVSVGAGVAPALELSYSRSGLASVELSAGVGVTSESRLVTNYPTPLGAQQGLELSFEGYDDGRILQAKLTVNDGSRRHYLGFRLEWYIHDLSIRSGLNAWTVIDSDFNIDTDLTAWHTIKLVYDLATQKYVRGILNRKQYDLSAYSIAGATWTGPTFSELAISSFGTATNVSYFRIDDVIITQNEPA